MKRIFIFLIPLVLSSVSQAENITQRLVDRNEYENLVQSLKPYLFDPSTTHSLLLDWLSEKTNSNYAGKCKNALAPLFPAEKILGPLCYFIYNTDEKKLTDLLKLNLLNLRLALQEITEDPRFSEVFPPNDKESHAQKAKRYLDFFNTKDKGVSKPALDNDIALLKSCLKKPMQFKGDWSTYDAFRDPNPKDCIMNGLQNAKPRIIKLLRTVKDKTTGEEKNLLFTMPYFSMNLTEEFTHSPGFLISATGWIKGNLAQYLNINDVSQELKNELHGKNELGPKKFLMPTTYPLTGRGSLKSFLSELRKNLKPNSPLDISGFFTEKEGFYPSFDSHPTWSQKYLKTKNASLENNIFLELAKAINEAKESIFMDIFFLGGTTGASLAKRIVERLESTPGLKALILRDNLNHYGHKAEMRPVYNFLLAYSILRPEKLVIASAYIHEHPKALPKITWSAVNKKFLVDSGLQNHLALYGEGKSDHSKTTVIDGKSKYPIAFVGSKNLTDASGPFCYDEVIKVSGPAAAVILDDYYPDMFAALQYAMAKEDSFADLELYQEIKEPHFVNYLSKTGWSKSLYKDNQSLNTQIANILLPFDLLERDENGNANAQINLDITDQGTGIVRAGMNNWDSSRTSAADQVIQAIYFAEKNVYISDQFLFDRKIVEALEHVMKVRGVEVKVILEPLKEVKPIPGMPNLLYLDILTPEDLAKATANPVIKWKITRGDEVINQEYHGKTISIDGKEVIAGSANKDQSTMFGSFREEQLEVIDQSAAKTHDDNFLTKWNSNEETKAFTHFDFEVPKINGNVVTGPDKKPLTPTEFIHILRDTISQLFDAKDYGTVGDDGNK